MTTPLATSGILLLALVISGCHGTGGQTASTIGIPPSQLVYPGFETYPTPREFDGPGTVFEQDEKGYLRYVTTLNVPVPQNPPQEDLGSLGGFSNMSLAAVARMLEAAEGVDLSASFARKSGAVKSAVLGDGYRARPNSEVSIDAIVAKAVKDRTLSLNPGARYWIVKETIQVDKLQFSLADWTGAHATFVAKLPQVDAGASADLGQMATKTVGRAYSSPRNLFFYRDEILPPTPGISVGPASMPRVVEVKANAKPSIAGFVFRQGS